MRSYTTLINITTIDMPFNFRPPRKGPEYGYTGRELELDLVGKPIFPRSFAAELKKAADNENGYVRRDKAMDLIRQFTPADPTNPPKDFARELRLAVIEALNLPDGDEVGFYSAVGTPVDLFHGVDAWVELKYAPVGRPESVHHAVVTLDVTDRTGESYEKYKEDRTKADVIVKGIPEPTDAQYLKKIEILGREIAHRIGDQLPRQWEAVPIIQEGTA